VYCLAVPIAEPFVTGIWPELTVCRHVASTGEPCAFCGLTRDARSLLDEGRLPDTPHNPLAVLFFTLFSFEALFRISAVLFARRTRLRPWLLADAVVHAGMAALLLLR